MSETQGLRGRLEYNLALARFTRWRVGGVADIAYFPSDVNDLSLFLKNLPSDVPLTVLGLGSNVLIRDGGVRGAVVLWRDISAEPRRDGDLIVAPAGLATPKLGRYAAQQGFGDAAFLAGIPGTVGGALAMNAGCYGDTCWAHVVSVNVIGRDGVQRQRSPEDYAVGYRDVTLKEKGGQQEWFTGATFRFDKRESVTQALADIKALLVKRAASQPLTLPNAGSVFRNPDGDFAGRLIEQCGLKGYSIGGAQVSEKHANFIVNAEGNATAADIEALILYVQRQVEAQTGIKLVPEIKMIGERE
jgi:UDP-N-acetylmuramate dehydrogenase